jgi:hypothetical protein
MSKSDILSDRQASSLQLIALTAEPTHPNAEKALEGPSSYLSSSKRSQLSAHEEVEFDPRWIGARISKPQWHFHRQLFKRYGIVLAVGQFSKIMKDIRYGRAPLIKARGEDGGIYSVHVKGAASRVYVLATGDIPRTAWPPEDAERLIKGRW